MFGSRLRVLVVRLLMRLGFRESSALLPLALLIGVVTAGAAVAFHELIVVIRDLLYRDPEFLYGRGLWLLVVLPAAGGLAVGLFSKYVIRGREGHGIVDVLESVTRSSAGTIRTRTAAEKILTSAVTIGTGGSAGAEGPIVQIGASIASGIGGLFQVARPHYPVLIGCGTAAGISAIFNSPIGGVLFTLEVILLDFSIRTFTPVVIASVVANVTTQRIFARIDPATANKAIFELPVAAMKDFPAPSWGLIVTFTALGVACGVVGVCLTRMMYATEGAFGRLPLPKPLRPALGGAVLGVMGAAYVVVFGWLLLGRAKPFDFQHYPMPAFFGDGYGAVQRLLQPELYDQFDPFFLAVLLAFLLLLKVVGTCLTLGSGGSGGVIAPSLFLGAVAGALLGIVLQGVGLSAGVSPHFYALVGMGAVLAAVVHAPLAALLILFDVTQQPDLIVPTMLATIVATGSARLIFPDSIYSLSLRRRGVRVGTSADLTLLRRLTVEQLQLEPVSVLRADAPFEKVVQLTAETGVSDFIVVDESGKYAGMVVAEDIRTALLEREAIPLLLVGEMARADLPPVKSTDDLATVLATFSAYEINRLPVCLAASPDRVIGLISRGTLMRQYHKALTET